MCVVSLPSSGAPQRGTRASSWDHMQTCDSMFYNPIRDIINVRPVNHSFVFKKKEEERSKFKRNCAFSGAPLCVKHHTGMRNDSRATGKLHMRAGHFSCKARLRRIPSGLSASFTLFLREGSQAETDEALSFASFVSQAVPQSAGDRISDGNSSLPPAVWL